MNRATVAHSLGGEVTSGHVLAPGPGHSKHDRSLAVFIVPDSPDLFRVHSFAGDDWRACRDHVRSLLGLNGSVHQSASRSCRVRSDLVVNSDAERIRRAQTIWAESVSISGAPAAVYLAGRGIDLDLLPKGIGGALRWHPACPWGTWAPWGHGGADDRCNGRRTQSHS